MSEIVASAIYKQTCIHISKIRVQVFVSAKNTQIIIKSKQMQNCLLFPYFLKLKVTLNVSKFFRLNQNSHNHFLLNFLKKN